MFVGAVMESFVAVVAAGGGTHTFHGHDRHRDCFLCLQKKQEIVNSLKLCMESSSLLTNILASRRCCHCHFFFEIVWFTTRRFPMRSQS